VQVAGLEEAERVRRVRQAAQGAQAARPGSAPPDMSRLLQQAQADAAGSATSGLREAVAVGREIGSDPQSAAQALRPSPSGQKFQPEAWRPGQ
jgi:hypothetical protein